MQMFGGGSPLIIFNPAIFKAKYVEFPIPKPGDPPPFLVELTFPSNPALTGQPISLLRNGEVIGKAVAGDGSVKVAATFNDGAPAPGELEIAIDAEGAKPIRIPVSGGTTPPPPPADLVVSGLTAFTVTVTNQGAGPAIASKAAITDSFPTTLTVDVPALAAGASATVQYDCSKLLRQRFATADSTGLVAESNEANNTLMTPNTLYNCNTG